MLLEASYGDNVNMRSYIRNRLIILSVCFCMLVVTYFMVNQREQEVEKSLQETGNIKETQVDRPFQPFQNPFGENGKRQALSNDRIEQERKKIILTYGEVLGHQYWWDTPHDFDFYEKDGTPCEYRHCKLVYDEFNYIRIADAVLFHGQDMPSHKQLKSLDKIPLMQLWIWMTSESPAGFSNLKSLDSYRHVFNWTATYRLDSDIWTPHFIVQPLPHPNPPIDYSHGKTKMMIIIMSNNCKSYRTKFIKKLQKYISIDVYGKCKTEFDPNLPECSFDGDDCKVLQSKYKFTLSLESAYCTDYVTEKFYYNGLMIGNIPVTMNRGKMSDPKVAPPNSFVNILDFENVETLANHLKKIASSDKLYNQFHAWRQNFKLGTKNRMCSICEALWKRDLKGLKGEKKIDFDKEWSYEKDCVSYEHHMFNKYLE